MVFTRKHKICMGYVSFREGTNPWNGWFLIVFMDRLKNLGGSSQRWDFHATKFEGEMKQGKRYDTVDGQNPAPPRMMIIPSFIGFYDDYPIINIGYDKLEGFLVWLIGNPCFMVYEIIPS